MFAEPVRLEAILSSLWKDFPEFMRILVPQSTLQGWKKKAEAFWAEVGKGEYVLHLSNHYQDVFQLWL